MKIERTLQSERSPSNPLSPQRANSSKSLSTETAPSSQPLAKVANPPRPALRSPAALRTNLPEALPRSGVQEYAPVRTWWLTRYFKRILFLLMVVLPGGAGTVYYCFLASRQYVTEFNLGIRMADPTLTSFAVAGSRRRFRRIDLAGRVDVGSDYHRFGVLRRHAVHDEPADGRFGGQEDWAAQPLWRQQS